MRFSTAYANSLFLLGVIPAVTGNPLPDDLTGIVQSIPSFVTSFEVGEPLLLEAPSKRTDEDNLELLSGADLDLEFDLEEDEDGTHTLVARAPSADQNEALKLHNAARSKKKVKALVWDSDLAYKAKAYAKVLAKKGTLEHSSSSSRPNQGENLAYMSSSSTISNPITLGTNGWLAEAKYYKGQKIPDGDFGSYGHYTQCVWNTTTKVGIAGYSDGKGGWYVVGRYSPPGNYVGQKPY